ncbi:MAG: GtrA family protein [Syntrophomonadaceae bacterium]|nr:GtrA family protein [Syntrophomonadaceae bacterium]
MRSTRLNLREYVSFLLCGAANTGLTYALYVLLLLVMPYKPAYSLAYVCGIGISYFLNSRLVFQEPVTLAKFLQYPAVYIVQYVLGIVVLYVCIDIIHISPWLAPVVVIIISLPVTFGISKLIIKGRS